MHCPKQIEHDLLLIIREDKGDRISVQDLPEKSVTSEDYRHMRMNTITKERILPKLTDETLIQITEQWLRQVKPIDQCVTIEEVLLHRVLPELLTRFKIED